MVRTHADDEYDHKLLNDVQQHGWHLVAIKEDPSGPAYVFSVGIFHTLGQPEICIFGLTSTKTMGQIINGIGSLMTSGKTFADWQESEDVLDGHSCIFRQVSVNLYQEYFGYARWFYESNEFPMLQCVWPDRANRFPWESEFDAQMVQSQPVLAEKPAWPFLEAKDQGVFATNRVLDDGYPILLVVHEDDGDWQFLCDTRNNSDGGHVVSLQYIVENHPSVAGLADLPMGWRAIRDAHDQPWRRIQST